MNQLNESIRTSRHRPAFLPAFPAAALCSVLWCGCGTVDSDTLTTTTEGQTTGTSSTGVLTTAGGSSSGSTSTAAASSSSGDSTETSASTDGGLVFDLGRQPDIGEIDDPGAPLLWYAVADRLIYIELDPIDGSVALLVDHQITTDVALSNAGAGIALLDDGGLLIARGPSSGPSGNYAADSSSIFYAPSPPTTVAGNAQFQFLGQLPDNIPVEAIHVDCEGQVYLMDSGTNSASSVGNRLLRLTGDYFGGDMSYEVITDLGMASVADIDDMSPGIDANGDITDSQGFAIDSGTVHDFDYVSGTGNALGMAGTYGIHALGGPLFEDQTARLYVLNVAAELFEVDPVTLASSAVLVTGPDVPGIPNGIAGLAGPLTACDTGFPQG
ncbi:MAG: hypothetical protein K0V04_08645 [Deltaproteobacteria bacterium]|nr:hypothetical protein [Deltaproteobacteria bacterium]